MVGKTVLLLLLWLAVIQSNSFSIVRNQLALTSHERVHLKGQHGANCFGYGYGGGGGGGSGGSGGSGGGDETMPSVPERLMQRYR